MGRIFISIAHFSGDPMFPSIRGTSHTQELIHTRDLVVRELKLRGLVELHDYLLAPDLLDQSSTIAWINHRALYGDVAVELQVRRGGCPGTEVFYAHLNLERQKDAQTVLDTFLNRVEPLGIVNRGVKPDVPPYTICNGLRFCRQVKIPSVILSIGSLSNHADHTALSGSRAIFAEGIADALVAFELDIRSRISGTLPSKLSVTDIELNGRTYEDRGFLMNDNVYIPMDLVDNLNIDLSQSPEVIRVIRGGVVYVKAIDLQPFGIVVRWNIDTQTTLIDSLLRNTLPTHIMSEGKTSAFELTNFLRDANSSDYIGKFPNIAEFYIDEARQEGVNHDIAFCQMCLETNYLKFCSDSKPNHNNFCNLGTIGGGAQPTSFFDMKTGIRAHIQHLKAYASSEPINKGPIVDPRFFLVKRGVAPSLNDLSGRWSIDPYYGNHIRDIVQRLYATSRL